MRIDGVIWLPEIVDKLLTKHDVTTDEVEEVLHDRPQWRWAETGNQKGEDVYAVMGQTLAGRYLVAFFVAKRPSLALVISARDMEKRERQRYEQHR